MKDWNERSAEERAAIERAIEKAVREANGKMVREVFWAGKKAA